MSVLMIVTFSLERYLAICHPFQLYAKSGMKRPVRFIMGAWLLALVCALPFGIYTTVNYLEYPARECSAIFVRILNLESYLFDTQTHDVSSFKIVHLEREKSCVMFF